jgi:general stress protein 26
MRKIVNARPDFDPMTEAEVDSFLESKLNVQQLATIDQTGDPNIQPFSLSGSTTTRATKKLYVTTGKTIKKVQNIRNKPTVYFSRIL